MCISEIISEGLNEHYPNLSKSEVMEKYKKIMSKLHPDMNDTDTTKLAQLVSEAKETIIKNDFS